MIFILLLLVVLFPSLSVFYDLVDIMVLIILQLI